MKGQRKTCRQRRSGRKEKQANDAQQPSRETNKQIVEEIVYASNKGSEMAHTKNAG